MNGEVVGAISAVGSICGGIWIALAPILWLMAAISSVESDVAFWVQLVVFPAAAIVGVQPTSGAERTICSGQLWTPLAAERPSVLRTQRHPRWRH